MVASRSMPEPSMSGWLAGRVRMPNSLSAGAPIFLDTETGGQVSSVMLLGRAAGRRLIGGAGGFTAQIYRCLRYVVRASSLLPRSPRVSQR